MSTTGKNYLKNLDSTDGLAAAVLSFFPIQESIGAKSYTGWDASNKMKNELRIYFSRSKCKPVTVDRTTIANRLVITVIFIFRLL
jgi:hypothetical protein